MTDCKIPYRLTTTASDGVMVKITKHWKLSWRHRLMYAWSILWRGTL